MTRNRDHNKITFGKKPFRDNHVKVYYKMLYLRLQFLQMKCITFLFIQFTDF